MKRQELLDILSENPGDPSFYDLAMLYASEGEVAEAMLTCVRGLSVDSGNDRARLLLAKLYFEADCVPFAAQEVERLFRNHPESSSLKSLNEKLNPTSVAADGAAQALDTSEEEVLAEADFEFDILEELEDD